MSKSFCDKSTQNYMRSFSERASTPSETPMNATSVAASSTAGKAAAPTGEGTSPPVDAGQASQRVGWAHVRL